MAQKSGIVAVTQALMHICRIITAYDTKLRAAIDAAVVSGAITEAQAETAKAFLSTAQTACTIYRAASGY